MILYFRWVMTLTLVYLALTSNLQISNIVVGILLGLIVVLLVRPQAEREAVPQNILRSAVALVRYIFHLAHVLFVSGIEASRIVLSPSLPIRPGIVAIPADTETDLGVTLSAHAITLVPGELVVEIDDDHLMYTHCLDATHAEEYVKEAQDMRRELLREIFY